MNVITQPTLILDKEICLRNIEQMAQKAKKHNLHFRPHFKTHQSAQIGEWFKKFNVRAITVSSVRMARYFAKQGWNDITLAFPLNVLEIEQIKELSDKISLNVLVENKESAKILVENINGKLGVFVKIDTGYNRSGILSSKTVLIDSILKILSENSAIQFKGFLNHTGNTYHAKSTNEIFTRHFDALLKLKSLKKKYKSNFPKILISMGDTPSCSIATNFKGVDEIRPGNFVFYDLTQHNLGVCKMDDIAVKMVCPVVSRHVSRNEIVVYCGAVHLSKDSIPNINGKNMFGRIVILKNGERELLEPLNYVSKLSQEHGTLKVVQKEFKKFKVGDLVEIIPVHSCLTANEMGHFFTTEGELIEMMPKY
jgi:D-serine deaminase-like pyridoxal phosphate-dependent protein